MKKFFCILFAFTSILAIANSPSSQEHDLNGTVSMDCSGAVVSLGRSDSQKAFVLSNGHCIKFMKPGTYIADKPSRRSLTVFSSSGQIQLKVSRVVYSTMTKTDLSLLEVESTYRELLDKGVKIFDVSKLNPEVGEEVEIISGYWKQTQTCKVDYLVSTLEEQKLIFNGSIALEKPCRIKGGWSGSPLVSAKSGEIIGIINTYNDGGNKCSFMNPCEISESGERRAISGKTYAQQVNLIWSCLNIFGNFDMSLPGCELPHEMLDLAP